MHNRLDACHRGFEIHASARELPDGRFAPVLSLTRQTGGVQQPMTCSVPPPDDFADRNAAAAHAFGFGMRLAEAEQHGERARRMARSPRPDLRASTAAASAGAGKAARPLDGAEAGAS